MADISMCTNSKCPLSSTCFRYLAKASQYQAYYILSPEDIDKIKTTGKCNEYWECKTKEDLEKYNRYWHD